MVASVTAKHRTSSTPWTCAISFPFNGSIKAPWYTQTPAPDGPHRARRNDLRSDSCWSLSGFGAFGGALDLLLPLGLLLPLAVALRRTTSRSRTRTLCHCILLLRLRLQSAVAPAASIILGGSLVEGWGSVSYLRWAAPCFVDSREGASHQATPSLQGIVGIVHTVQLVFNPREPTTQHVELALFFGSLNHGGGHRSGFTTQTMNESAQHAFGFEFTDRMTWFFACSQFTTG